MNAKDLVITRVFDAPRTLVFKAWTEPRRMQRWWGPTGFTAPVVKMDPRPGGTFHGCMRGPDGKDYWSKGVYREVVEPERIVSTDSFSDAEGNLVSPTEFGMSADWPAEALLTVTLTERDGKTTLTMEHGIGSAPEPEREMCRQGWNETLDKLEACLAAA